MMILIYITLIAMIAMAAARKPKRRMGRYIRGGVDENLGLGTLAASALVSADFDETVRERTLISSLVASWSLSNWTPIASVGPIVVGVAHSDYTDAEIEAYIENLESWDEGDKIGQEIGRRKIRRVGQFAVTAVGDVGVMVLNDGKPIKTKLNWILNAGQTLSYWAYNQGTAAVATTNPDVRLQGHVNLFPK